MGGKLHGQSSTKVYLVWKSMRARCYRKTDRNFHQYGGRGIDVCPQWASFPAFIEDMGPRPEGYTLERRDNNRGYWPDNCMWAPYKQQQNNKRTNRLISFDGRTLTLSQWCDELGLTKGALTSRLKRGWSVADALRKGKARTGRRLQNSPDAVRWRPDQEAKAEQSEITQEAAE